MILLMNKKRSEGEGEGREGGVPKGEEGYGKTA